MPFGLFSLLGHRRIVVPPKTGKAQRRAAGKRARASRKTNRRR